MKKNIHCKKYLLILICIFIFINAKTQVPERIISLAPSITKNLLLLDLETKMVGITSYCDLKNAYDIPTVASAVEVNLEKIVSLKPDLVLATSLTKPETLEKLKILGLKVKYFPLPKSFMEIENQFQDIASLTQTSAKAKKILIEEREKQQQLYALIDTSSKLRIFMEIGSSPLWCVIPNTFMNDFITFSGCVNIANDLTNGAISRESVIIRNPDIIVIVTMGNIGKEEIDIWNSYAHLKAVKNKKIFVINSDLACSPTPIDLTKTLEQMIINIYK
jgi:iron complex transport system substrate-binding protein